MDNTSKIQHGGNKYLGQVVASEYAPSDTIDIALSKALIRSERSPS